MKKILLSLIFLIFFIVNIFTQNKEPRKFDEFSSYSCEEMLLFLDMFTNELSKETNSKGFIIIYEGKHSRFVPGSGNGRFKSFLPRFGESAYRTKSMQNYLLNFRNFPKENFLFISGGFRENHTVEFWIVPNGANPPKPTPTLENIKYRNGKSEDICAGLG